MKVIWEEKDIVAGRRFGLPDVEEQWMIGYLSSTEGENRYVYISNQDGLVTDPRTMREIAKNLTVSGYLPVELL